MIVIALLLYGEEPFITIIVYCPSCPQAVNIVMRFFFFYISFFFQFVFASISTRDFGIDGSSKVLASSCPGKSFFSLRLWVMSTIYYLDTTGCLV